MRIVCILLAFFVVSCNTVRFGHYPKAKKNSVTIATQTKKKIIMPSVLPAKGFEQQIAVYEVKKYCPPVSLVNYPLPKIKPIATPKEKANKNTAINKRRPGDVTPVNKKAVVSFWATIGALGFLVAAIAIHPVLLVGMLLLALLGLVLSMQALKRIRKTGEYGGGRAQFAQYVCIALLVIAVALLVAIATSSTGVQIGNVVL